jgi:hypothetical protein
MHAQIRQFGAITSGDAWPAKAARNGGPKRGYQEPFGLRAITVTHPPDSGPAGNFVHRRDSGEHPSAGQSARGNGKQYLTSVIWNPRLSSSFTVPSANQPPAS